MLVEAGEYRPDGEQFAEGSASDQTGSVANPFDIFVERLAGETPESDTRGVQVADPFTPFYLMHSVNERFEGVPTYADIRFEPTPEQNEKIKHVKLAYGIIAHPFCEMRLSDGRSSHIHQKVIEHQVAIERVYEGRNRVVLTDEERELLIKIAKTAGIPCDPERSEYFFDEIPRMTFEEEGFIQPNVVDADQ
jgi:hypothetical protein